MQSWRRKRINLSARSSMGASHGQRSLMHRLMSTLVYVWTVLRTKTATNTAGSSRSGQFSPVLV
jgi:hypothetical protein